MPALDDQGYRYSKKLAEGRLPAEISGAQTRSGEPMSEGPGAKPGPFICSQSQAGQPRREGMDQKRKAAPSQGPQKNKEHLQ